MNAYYALHVVGILPMDASFFEEDMFTIFVSCLSELIFVFKTIYTVYQPNKNIFTLRVN